MLLEGKVAIVSGIGPGMGRDISLLLAEHGADLVLGARRTDKSEEVAAEVRTLGRRAEVVRLDITEPASCDEAVAVAVDRLGGVDILVNNAGVPKRKHVTQLDAATVDEITRINYLAPVQLTLALLPHMIERGSGRIVNVSSVAATLSSPGEAAYDASKAALAVFSEAMAVDLWETGVKVLTVYPGVVDTPLFDIPDNDPLPDEIDRIPVDELVDGVMDALDHGVSEVYVPAWFKDIAAGKAANIEGFLAGTAEWVRAHRAV